MQRLIEVNRVDGDIAAKPTNISNSLEETFEEIVQLLFGDKETIEIPGLELGVNILHNLIHKEVPMVFLKQFRDVRDGKRACYQAIIEAPASLLKFRAGGQLQGNYNVILSHFNSHPLREELGLNTEQTARAAFWLDFDFIMEKGSEVWKAP